MTIFVSIIALIILISLAIARYGYNVAFRTPREVIDENSLPTGKQYDEHYDTLKKASQRLLAVPFEEIYTDSFDGLKLYGRYYHKADNAPVHILFHGYKASPFVDCTGGSGLAFELGHNALIPDQRAMGKSTAKTITFGINERKDCLSWIEYVRNRFGADTPIILWGVSMGAATVLMANDLDLPDNIACIIADCPFSSPKAIIKKVCTYIHYPADLLYPFIKLGASLFGHFDLEESCAVEAVKRANAPILLFHGGDDRFVPCYMSKEIKEANPEIISLEIVETAGHGLSYMIEAQRYHDTVIQFVKNSLK